MVRASKRGEILEDGHLFVPEGIKRDLHLKKGEKFILLGNEDELICRKVKKRGSKRAVLEGILKGIEFAEEDFLQAKRSLFKGI